MYRRQRRKRQRRTLSTKFLKCCRICQNISPKTLVIQPTAATGYEVTIITPLEWIENYSCFASYGNKYNCEKIQHT